MNQQIQHRPGRKINKLLVANRGEIALRIIRTAKKMGIVTVALYVEQEKKSAYVTLADEAISLGGGSLESTFLNLPKILSAALSAKADAIHPGYGFLSENPAFVKACDEHQLLFVGPDAFVLSLTANKPESKKIAASLGIPVLRDLAISHDQPVVTAPGDFPLLIKAAFGGGGKGMQIVSNETELLDHLDQSSRKALNYFGNGTLFAERYLRHARHVEVQLMGDHHGNLVHLFERECSIQRNHQKIIEEAPAQFLSTDLRHQILDAALRFGRFLNYSGAGTVEFLTDDTGNFYFMEMNPRIQVEHAVTEQITGIDLVEAQLIVASGLPLPFTQEEIRLNGHAIEARVYAEDPPTGFKPSAEVLHHIHWPDEAGLRVEADLICGVPLCNQFDPMLLKLIAHGTDRNEACHLLRNALSELNLLGPANNVNYLESILAHQLFQHDQISIEFCQQQHPQLCRADNLRQEPELSHLLLACMVAKSYSSEADAPSSDPWHVTGYWRNRPNRIVVQIDGAEYRILLGKIDHPNYNFWLDGQQFEFVLEKITDTKVVINRNGNLFHGCIHELRRGELIAGWHNKSYRIRIPGMTGEGKLRSDPSTDEISGKSTSIASPMYGKVVQIMVKEQQVVRRGDPLLVIESMKSENSILAHRDATIKQIAVNVGTQVTDRMPLIFLEV